MHFYTIFFVSMSFMAVSPLGCNSYFSSEIRLTSWYNLPDKINFLEIRGVIAPIPPPGSFGSGKKFTLYLDT